MMMTKELTPRILRQVVPNDKCLKLDVNIRISTDYIESFHFPLRDSSEKYIEKVGPIGGELVRKLNDILGIETASLQQYGVQVIVGDAFDPDEDGITDDAIEALKDCFGDKRDEVQVVNKDVRHRYRDSMMNDDFGLGGPRFIRDFGDSPTDEDIDEIISDADRELARLDEEQA